MCPMSMLDDTITVDYKVAVCKGRYKDETILYLPQEARTGNSGCLAIDFMLPQHLPTNEPNILPAINGHLNFDN